MLAPTPNQAAFLEMIAVSEGTAKALDPFRVCYRPQPPKAAHIIVSFDDHPVLTGEWRGEQLDQLGPSYKGLWSTAAGKFQITKGTWLTIKAALGIRTAPGVQLFAPDYQVQGCLWLVQNHGALTAVNTGNVNEAVFLLSNVWASFSSSNAPDQPHHALAMLEEAFQDHGGRILAA